MEIITYSLRNGQQDSEQYYNDISAFTDEVLAQANELVIPLVEKFKNFIKSTGRETLRSKEEYGFELLMLGTLWQIYCDDGMGLAALPGNFLAALGDLRQQGGMLKPGIDFLRGILGTLFLSPIDRPVVKPELNHMNKLVEWLNATGDYEEEVARLEAWREFFSTLSQNEACDHIATAITFAAWFKVRSEQVLGKYTANVENFIKNVRPAYRWREDYIFSGRKPVEYHLNMVGAEIMNRAFRKEFLKTPKKAVLLPVCMRGKPEGQCRAEGGPGGYVCTGCMTGCKVNQLTALGKANGFKVYMIPHGSQAFSGDVAKDGTNEGLGIIGVACVLNLISGGWKAKAMGLPPQCVLLDYCGCKSHWHEEGIPTEINIEKLKKLLEIEK